MKYHINYKLTDSEGKEIHFTLPYCWEGVTFRQMEKIWDSTEEQLEDEGHLMQIFTPITKETWEKCSAIDLLFTVNNTLKFLADHGPLMEKGNQPSNKFTWNGIEREVPKDIAIKSIGQYKDMVKFCISTDPVGHAKMFPLMAAIYMQPRYDLTINERFTQKNGEYDFSKAKELAEELKDVAITDIISLAAFFLPKLSVSKIDSPGFVSRIMKKLRQALA